VEFESSDDRFREAWPATGVGLRQSLTGQKQPYHEVANNGRSVALSTEVVDHATGQRVSG